MDAQPLEIVAEASPSVETPPSLQQLLEILANGFSEVIPNDDEPLFV